MFENLIFFGEKNEEGKNSLLEILVLAVKSGITIILSLRRLQIYKLFMCCMQCRGTGHKEWEGIGEISTNLATLGCVIFPRSKDDKHTNIYCDIVLLMILGWDSNILIESSLKYVKSRDSDCKICYISVNSFRIYDFSFEIYSSDKVLNFQP